MAKWIGLAVVALLVLAGSYYYFLYPPKIIQRKAEAALMHFSSVVATKDRAKIGETLGQFLTDDAQIHLDVGFFSLSTIEETGSGGRQTGQDFDKASFLGFVDNILYTLTDYSYEPEIQSFILSLDRTTASMTFTSKEWADGMSYYGGTAVEVRFSSHTTCSSDVSFATPTPVLTKLNCRMQLRMVPKPSEMSKLRGNPEALKQLLQ